MGERRKLIKGQHLPVLRASDLWTSIDSPGLKPHLVTRGLIEKAGTAPDIGSTLARANEMLELWTGMACPYLAVAIVRSR